MPLIALTGGPGAGKTTVITALRALGYNCVPDSARAVIQERLRQGLAPRPSPCEFANQILSLDTEQYRRMAHATGPAFFDRCVLDALAMVEQLGLVTTLQLQELLARYPYFRTAFCFPPWEEIYTTDAERDQTFEDAVAVHAAASDWYRRCGYDVAEVPHGTACERCDFILQRVSRDS